MGVETSLKYCLRYKEKYVFPIQLKALDSL